MFLALAARPSFVETAISTGRLLRKCDLHAIRTGVAVIAFASFEIVLPVHGTTATTSSSFLGPIGSASLMVQIGSWPVIRTRVSYNSSLVINRVDVSEEEYDKIG